MNLKTNGTNFCGRYALVGKAEQANMAAYTIKTAKKDDVEFYPVTCKDRKIVIVATDEDAVILRSKKTENNLNSNIRELCKNKKNFISNLFKLIFGTDSDALLLQDDDLARFIMPRSVINYSNGTSSSRYKSAETFVDGTIKRYSLRGRLCELVRPDGVREILDIDGSKTLIYPDGKTETIGKKEKKTIENKSPKPEIPVEKFKIEIPKSCPKQAKSPKTEERSRTITPIIIPEAPVLMPIINPENTPEEKTATKITTEENSLLQNQKFIAEKDIFDEQRRLVGRTFENGITANYHYNGNTREILFAYFSDGHFESSKGIINPEEQTISFEHRDGILKVLDKDGNLRAFIFPNGIRKNYDKQENLTEKIYPNGKKELFSKEGSMYLIIHPDGTYEDVKPTFPNRKTYY